MALSLISDIEFDPSTIHLFYARTLFALGNINASEKEALLAFQISERDKNLKMISESSELLSKIFAKNNNFEKTYAYQTGLVFIRTVLIQQKNLMKLKS